MVFGAFWGLYRIGSMRLLLAARRALIFLAFRPLFRGKIIYSLIRNCLHHFTVSANLFLVLTFTAVFAGILMAYRELLFCTSFPDSPNIAKASARISCCKISGPRTLALLPQLMIQCLISSMPATSASKTMEPSSSNSII